MARKQQPKQQARGMLSDPRGRFEGAPRDRGPNFRVKLGKERFGNKRAGISKDARALINQREAADLALGDMSQAMLPGVQRAFEQPFDTSQLPESPWSQGQNVKDMHQQYMDSIYGNYMRNMQPSFDKEQQDFETSMVQRGIPVGSELYNQQKKLLLDNQESQKQNIMTQAMAGAGQEATTWNNISGQNFQGAYDYYNAERNRPLAEYNMLTASQSGMADKALDQIYARQNAKWQMANQPQGGGGGGGGGGGYMYQQYGFSTPQEYDAYKLQQSMAAKEAEYALANKYAPKSQQPSGWAGALGGILGGVAQGVGGGLGKGIAGWF